jgi:DNA polymerase-1
MLGRSLASWEELVGRGAKAVAAESLPPDSLVHWAGAQVCAIRALQPLMWERLERDELLPLFRQVEMPLTRTLSRMERAGVRIDEDKLGSLAEEYRASLERLEEEIYQQAGERFLVSSPKQLQVILFEKLKLPALKKTKTGYSTAEGVLEQLTRRHELPGLILAWRRLSKLMTTYIDALPPLVSERSGRIHPHFHQTGAATGRLSASHPNVQNIPIRTPEGIRVREAFVPREGFLLLSADYSQVELRILAHYSGDHSLVDAFSRGEDVHRRTAAEVAGIAPSEVLPEQRERAKAVNFGIIYGSSAFGLANQLDIAVSEAQATIDAYFERYGGVRSFIDETVRRAAERGYVTTLLGRRRYLPDLKSRNRTLRQAAERMATNTVIQGTAADLIKKAMVEVDDALRAERFTARMILQVHDELVFELPQDEEESLGQLARSRMQEVFELKVPLVVDVGVGRSWREAH